MFICNNCIKAAEENLKNDENNNNNNISINNISFNSDLTEILNERTKRKKIIFDKVNMNCKETTVCIIF
jgi:protoheme ferro-lyase